MLGRETDLSSPSSCDVKNMRICSPALTHLEGLILIEHRDWSVSLNGGC
jgi:hypothetical protein